MKRFLQAIYVLCIAVLGLLFCMTACSETEIGTETDVLSDSQNETAEKDGITDTATEPILETDSEMITETSTEEQTENSTESASEVETADGTMSSASHVKIVSYNLDANLDTVSRRAEGMCSIISGLDPDSFGVQECRPAWLKLLTRYLKDYSYIGVSADGDNPSATTFGTYVFYKTEKYNVIDSGTFWLSKTPDEPSRYGPTVDCNRTCCWVILEDRETGFRYVHMNSHLDWMDVEATNYQFDLIRTQIEYFEALGLPVFATGDYNVDEGTATYQRMLKSDKIGDAKFLAEKSMDIGTYPNYDVYDVNKTKPIDFCFVTKDRVNVREYRVVNDKYNDAYVSDHFGVFVEADVPAAKNLFETAAAPAFNGEITVSDVKANRALITFPAADDFTAQIKDYTVTVTDAAGAVVSTQTVRSGYLMPKAPTSFTYNVSGLLPDTSYTVTVTAENFFMKESAPLTAAFKTEAPAQSEQVGDADVFNLVLGETWADASPAAMDITAVGNVAVREIGGEKALVFDGGNLKMPAIKDWYTTLANGFTMELDITVGAKTAFNSIMSNMHAGGFGFDIEGGTLEFAVYVGGNYKGVTTKVTAGDRLHLVAVYDGNVLSLYVNGELADSQKVGKISSFATDNGAKYLCLGADSDASGKGEYPTDSVVYAARIWSEPITAGQAIYLFAESRK